MFISCKIDFFDSQRFKQIKMKIKDIRNEYDFPEFNKSDADNNPFEQFRKWLREAIDSEEKEPTAMSLSTIGTDGYPQIRIVLLKDFDENGFVFFSNYSSDKGKSLEANPVAGLNFFWATFERQVRISGTVKKTSLKVSEDYFKSRPAKSRIAAWISEQSKEIPSREYLENLYDEFQEKSSHKSETLPPFWGGYIVIPEKIEFWQGRTGRLHDRILYVKENEEWIKKRLAP